MGEGQWLIGRGESAATASEACLDPGYQEHRASLALF